MEKDWIFFYHLGRHANTRPLSHADALWYEVAKVWLIISLSFYLREDKNGMVSSRFFLTVSAWIIVVGANAQDDRGKVRVPSKVIGRDADGKDALMPMLGAGTWQYNDTLAYESVCKAFQAGYTFVDTAFGKNPSDDDHQTASLVSLSPPQDTKTKKELDWPSKTAGRGHERSSSS